MPNSEPSGSPLRTISGWNCAATFQASSALVRRFAAAGLSGHCCVIEDQEGDDWPGPGARLARVAIFIDRGCRRRSCAEASDVVLAAAPAEAIKLICAATCWGVDAR